MLWYWYMNNNLELVLVLFAMIVGLISSLYFYQSADIFVISLQKPLKYISTGITMIILGIFLAVFISFEYSIGNIIYVYTLPLNFIFFLLYLIGTLLIFIGARKFSHRPK